MPVTVSLAAYVCGNAENKLKIIDNKPKTGTKKGFGLCSKSLSFDNRDFVIRFIEWVHLQRILGVDKITLFNRHVHPEMFEILNYFQDKNYIEVKQFLEPSGLSTAAFRSQQVNMLEVMELTDCFYRTRNLYEYIVVMDPDEIIAPRKAEDYTLHDLVKRLDHTKEIVAFQPRNSIYLDLGRPLYSDIPKYHYILQHTEVIHDHENVSF